MNRFFKFLIVFFAIFSLLLSISLMGYNLHTLIKNSAEYAKYTNLLSYDKDTYLQIINIYKKSIVIDIIEIIYNLIGLTLSVVVLKGTFKNVSKN